MKINATQCPSNTPTLNVSANAFNQLVGFSYDAAGNMTGDGVYTYSWDDENHLTSGNGWSYFYDGDGKLVKKTTGTLFWKALDGTTLEETDLSGNLVESYIFLAGRRVAQRDAASGNVFYYLPDALGATRTLATASGTLCFDADYYPFGDEIDFTSNCSGQAYQQYRYAGMELHPDIGSKYLTMFRIYTTNQGRWMSPDPLGGDITNPQSLNRYAYVLNNPTSLTDPLGLGSVDCSKFGNGGSSCAQGTGNIPDASTPTPPVFDVWASMSPEMQAAEADYASQFVFRFMGNLYPGNPYVNTTFSSFDEFANWATDVALLPQNKIYDAFWALLENNGLNPDVEYPVTVYLNGPTYNVRLPGVALNTAAASQGRIHDPYHGTHPDSWYGLSPVDTLHLAVTPLGAEAHFDLFNGVILFPLHELFDYLPSLLINPKSQIPQNTSYWFCSGTGDVTNDEPIYPCKLCARARLRSFGPSCRIRSDHSARH